MKRNPLLRTAACFALAVVVSTSMLGGTFAKHTAAAVATNKDFVAKFSFIVGSTKTHTETAGPYDNERHPVRVGLLPGEEQIAIGTVAQFEVPLFDNEYWGFGATAGDITVQGRGSGLARDIVVAPGTGWAFGPGKNNPNYYGDPSNVFMTFKNDSDVTVRFQLSVVNGSATADARETPVNFFTPEHGWPLASTTQPIVLTWEDDAKANPKNSPVDLWSGGQGTRQSGWMTLEPEDEYTLGVAWIWDFDTERLGQPAGTLDDERDSLLGMARADYLRAEAKSGATSQQKAAAQLKLVFNLAVLQVN